MSSEPSVCYGVDLAKSFDFTVITGLDRFGKVSRFERFQRDWRATREAILGLPPGLICIDATGVGDPIAEDIANVRETEIFKFTVASKQQLMEGLAYAIQNRNCTVLEGVMKDELDSFEYEYTRTGVKYTAPSGMHDDAVCSLALAVRIHKNVALQGEFSVY
jgi:hypothetical protein